MNTNNAMLSGINGGLSTVGTGINNVDNIINTH